MGTELLEEADIEVLPMWPDDLMNAAEKQFNLESKADRDMLDDVAIGDDPSVADFKTLLELTSYSEKGSSQLAYLVKSWEYKQANAARLLNEELSFLSIQRTEAELKKLEIIEAHRFEQEKHVGDKQPISIPEEVYDIWGAAPRRSNDGNTYDKAISIDVEHDTVHYWKQHAIHLEKLLEESIQREQILMQKLQEKLINFQTQSSPVDELSQILKRADNYLHFILQTAPVVIGHQDKELRYRFIYNHFPRLGEEDIIGKTDTEIFTGLGVKESHDFKREVLERGLPAKREITFETELFGKKTFLIYVEPVFSKAGETIGVNCMGMDVTDQVIKREKMVKLHEKIAVQKAKETELNKTIHITEETMRAKQMLATMSHEIRSPLTGVLSMAEILANTKLDKEQYQLLDVMISSGDLVLQLINDILDLSKVESGVMKLEATKFRPREVVKHVLQTAAASLRKELTLEGHVDNDVPIEVIGDVLRIRQILTNLISNAVKFTHGGKVGVNLQLLPEQSPGLSNGHDEVLIAEDSTFRLTTESPLKYQSCRSRVSQRVDKEDNGNCNIDGEIASLPLKESRQPYEKIVLLRCDVYDTGIGIPEKALPSLFKRYMQVSVDHARKYGGTGLGLAICKQLVELMGGHLSVTSQVNHGSTFTFILPYKVPPEQYFSDDSDGDTIISRYEVKSDKDSDEFNGSFLFTTCSLSSGFSLCGSPSRKYDLLCGDMLNTLIANNELPEESESYSYICSKLREKSAPEVSLETLQDNRNKTETINRKDEECQVSVGLMDVSNFSNSDTGISYNVESSTCSPVGSILEDSSFQSCQSKLSCQNRRLEKEEQNAQITSNGNPECRLKREEQNNHITSNEKPEFPETGSAPKILLVEDNKINMMVAKSMLNQLGHKIDVVHNGLEAIYAVQRAHYDLILMDVCMPVMDGLHATKHIRSFEECGYWDSAVACSDSPTTPLGAKKCRKRTAIIAMTANAMAESAADCLAVGMDSFVSKPVTFQKLKDCLQQFSVY